MATKKPQPAYLTAPADDGLDWDYINGFLSEARAGQTSVGQDQTGEPSGKMRRLVGDTALSVGKSAIGLGESAVGLADLGTGGRAGKFLEDTVGYRPAEARQMLDESMTPEQQAANRAVQEADGFFGKVGAAIQNPSTIAHAAVESALPMLAGGGIARAGGKLLSEAAGPMSRALMVGAGEGIVSAGSSAESIRQESADGMLSGKQSLIAAGSGLVTAGVTAGGARLMKSLGIGDIDSLIAGANMAGPAAQRGLLRKTLEGFVAEGGEELTQSISDQVAQNIALNRPIETGVDYAAAMGLLTGGAMGAGASHFGGGHEQQPAGAW
jgi:hypothetical protein